MVGAGLIILGVVTLFGGLISQITPIGILGFLFALSGVITAISSISAPVRGPRKPSSRSSLSARLEQRWENRGNEQ
jgi:uncharacterized membrane protein HdeD (DUF308 family)